MRVRPTVPGAVLAAAAVVVVGLAALLAAHQPAPPAAPPRVLGGPGQGAAPVPVVPGDGGVPWWVLPAIVVVIALGVALLWFIFRDLLLGADVERREVGRLADDEDARHAAELTVSARRALTEAGEELDRGADAREVVVACWVRIEEAAQGAGLGRRPAETATDVARRWLAAGPDRAAVDDLAALYHLARYSTHPLTADHRARARAALRGALGTAAVVDPRPGVPA